MAGRKAKAPKRRVKAKVAPKVRACPYRGGPEACPAPKMACDGCRFFDRG